MKVGVARYCGPRYNASRQSKMHFTKHHPPVVILCLVPYGKIKLLLPQCGDTVSALGLIETVILKQTLKNFLTSAAICA